MDTFSVSIAGDWFALYVREEQHMFTQGGWVDSETENIFMFVMQGLKQRWMPEDLAVHVTRTNEITANIPYRNTNSPYGFFEVNIFEGTLNVTLYHPLRYAKVKHWVFLFDHDFDIRDLPWKEWNETLMYLE